MLSTETAGATSSSNYLTSPSTFLNSAIARSGGHAVDLSLGGINTEEMVSIIESTSGGTDRLQVFCSAFAEGSTSRANKINITTEFVASLPKDKQELFINGLLNIIRDIALAQTASNTKTVPDEMTIKDTSVALQMPRYRHRNRANELTSSTKITHPAKALSTKRSFFPKRINRSMLIIIALLAIPILLMSILFLKLQSILTESNTHKLRSHKATNLSLSESEFAAVAENPLGATLLSWNLPLPSINFVNRKLIMNKIESVFEHSPKINETTTITVLRGLSGAGKTQLAIFYANHPHITYSSKAWFDTSPKNNVQEQYLKLGQSLAFNKNITTSIAQNNAEMITSIKNYFNANPSWLWIFDDAEDYESIKSFIPTWGGHVLVTSKSLDWQIKSIIEIEEMEPLEAKSLVHLVTGIDESNREIDQLVKLLAYFPLPIAQASAFIKKKGASISEYTKLYQASSLKVLNDSSLPDGDQHLPFTATIRVNINSAIADSPKAAYILKACAVLGVEYIPEALILSILPEEESVIEKELQYRNAIASLLDYSLIKINTELETISLHQLIHNYLQTDFPISEKAQYVKQFLYNFDKQVSFIIEMNIFSMIHFSANRLLNDLMPMKINNQIPPDAFSKYLKNQMHKFSYWQLSYLSLYSDFTSILLHNPDMQLVNALRKNSAMFDKIHQLSKQFLLLVNFNKDLKIIIPLYRTLTLICANPRLRANAVIRNYFTTAKDAVNSAIDIYEKINSDLSNGTHIASALEKFIQAIVIPSQGLSIWLEEVAFSLQISLMKNDTNFIESLKKLLNSFSQSGSNSSFVKTEAYRIPFKNLRLQFNYSEYEPNLTTTGNINTEINNESARLLELNFYQKQLIKQKKIFGDDHLVITYTLLKISNLYQFLNDLEMAINYHESALAIQLKHLGAIREEFLVSYVSLILLHINHHLSKSNKLLSPKHLISYFELLLSTASSKDNNLDAEWLRIARFSLNFNIVLFVLKSNFWDAIRIFLYLFDYRNLNWFQAITSYVTTIFLGSILMSILRCFIDFCRIRFPPNNNEVIANTRIATSFRNNQTNSFAFDTEAKININGLKHQTILDTGHCFYHAVGLYLGQDHLLLRDLVAAHLEKNLTNYQDIISAYNSSGSVIAYIAEIRAGTERIDGLDRAILMKVLNRPIIVIGPEGKISNLQDYQKYTGDPIFVYDNGRNHYDACLLVEGFNAHEVLARVNKSISLTENSTHSFA